MAPRATNQQWHRHPCDSRDRSGSQGKVPARRERERMGEVDSGRERQATITASDHRNKLPCVCGVCVCVCVCARVATLHGSNDQVHCQFFIENLPYSATSINNPPPSQNHVKIFFFLSDDIQICLNVCKGVRLIVRKRRKC